MTESNNSFHAVNLLLPGHGDDIVKLYDLTTLSSDCMAEDASENPFTAPVGILLYRVARNIHTTYGRKKSGTIRTLLLNCIELLDKTIHPQVRLQNSHRSTNVLEFAPCCWPFLSTFLPPLPFSDLSSHNPPIFHVFCNLLGFFLSDLFGNLSSFILTICPALFIRLLTILPTLQVLVRTDPQMF